MTPSPIQPQDNLDRLLTQHVNRELNPHQGRAAIAFRKHLQTAPLPNREIDRPNYRIPRVVTYGVPSALAASLVLAATIYFNQPQRLPISPVNPNIVQASNPQLDEVVLTRNVDDGMAILENEPGGPMPVRIVREQTLRHAEWIDPNDKATYTFTQPMEKVGFVRIQPN